MRCGGKVKGDGGRGVLWWRGDGMTAVGFVGLTIDIALVVEIPTENNMVIGDTDKRKLSSRPTQR